MVNVPLMLRRLLACWLMYLAYPPCQGSVSALSLPLPEEPPVDFTVLPDYFVEDVVDILLNLSRAAPNVSVTAVLDQPEQHGLTAA
jgi:ubiquitin conjugation factor E4 B